MKSPQPVRVDSAPQSVASTSSIPSHPVTSNGSSNGPVVDVEVRLLPSHSRSPQSLYEPLVLAFHRMRENGHLTFDQQVVAGAWNSEAELEANVHSIRIGEGLGDIASCRPRLHMYLPATLDATMDLAADYGEDDEGEDVMAAVVTELPNESLDGVWDTLIYTDDVKTRLLKYIHTTMLFSDANIDFNIITWNRVVLLHGPPGTGKTTLCRALAQKLAIRLGDRYSHGKLIEINSHSLFSKWFSESGKLVQKLFASVTEMAEDPHGFVVILIDEVESLTAARSSAMSGSEPSDALRVVNAILTQLDKLKQKKNVLVMTTSNLSESIDNAFVDRADIKQYIPLPPAQAVYWILKSCLEELMRVGLIQSTHFEPFGQQSSADDTTRQASRALELLSHQCVGVSGRTLRRLPVLAHARYIGLVASQGGNATDPSSVLTWIEAMQYAIKDHLREMEQTLEGSRIKATAV